MEVYDDIKTLFLILNRTKVKNKRIKRAKLAFSIDEVCNKYKYKFDDIVYKIKKRESTLTNSINNSWASIKSSQREFVQNNNKNNTNLEHTPNFSNFNFDDKKITIIDSLLDIDTIDKPDQVKQNPDSENHLIYILVILFILLIILLLLI